MMLVLALSLALSADTVTFPSVTSENLEGKTLTLPRDFGGARMVAPMRWMINRGMRGGIDDRSARDRTITLYVDKAPFKQSLGIADENAIQVLVVDRAGQVLWRTTGAYNPDKARGLEAALAGR